MKSRLSLATIALAVSAISTAANAAVVYQSGSPNTFYTPFSSSTPAGTKFGDSGYLGSGPASTLTEITLGLATFSQSDVAAGSADIVFTFNQGDPSGLVFGPGTQLYSTVIPNVTLPAIDGGSPSNFQLTIPLPNIATAGGFNDVGWSVGVQNFNYGGQFGFQNSGFFNSVGFITGNASQYNPSAGTWSLFSFGPAFPGDSANFVATISTPEPASLSLIASLGLLAKRRRR